MQKCSTCRAYWTALALRNAHLQPLSPPPPTHHSTPSCRNLGFITGFAKSYYSFQGKPFIFPFFLSVCNWRPGSSPSCSCGELIICAKKRKNKLPAQPQSTPIHPNTIFFFLDGLDNKLPAPASVLPFVSWGIFLFFFLLHASLAPLTSCITSHIFLSRINPTGALNVEHPRSRERGENDYCDVRRDLSLNKSSLATHPVPPPPPKRITLVMDKWLDIQLHSAGVWSLLLISETAWG